MFYSGTVSSNGYVKTPVGKGTMVLYFLDPVVCKEASNVLMTTLFKEGN